MAKWQPAMRSATSSAEPYCPDRGDIISINFDPQAGREMAGRHFALVLSTRQYNQLTRLCLLCPITGQVKGFPFETKLPQGFVLGEKGGGGAVLADQIKSLSWGERGSRFICKSPDGILEDVLAKIKPLLGFA